MTRIGKGPPTAAVTLRSFTKPAPQPVSETGLFHLLRPLIACISGYHWTAPANHRRRHCLAVLPPRWLSRRRSCSGHRRQTDARPNRIGVLDLIPVWPFSNALYLRDIDNCIDFGPTTWLRRRPAPACAMTDESNAALQPKAEAFFAWPRFDVFSTHQTFFSIRPCRGAKRMFGG